jgi:hypothetical protein
MNVVPYDASTTGRDVLPRKQVDGATLGRLFQQLAPLAKDPLTFESKASVVCASFDLDPTTSMEIVASFKQQQSADQTQGPRYVQSCRAIGIPSLTSSFNLFRTPPAGTSGPTTSEPIDQRASDTLALIPTVANPTGTPTPTPFKQERPFSSGSPGITTWYTSSSPNDIAAPPTGVIPEVGELYVHHNRVTDIYHVWLYGIDQRWKCVTDVEKVYHPVIDDRVLSMRANGTPNWITAASFTTIRGRKGKARQVV